jgi:hypothetical protein
VEPNRADEFLEQARGGRVSLWREAWGFLSENKKWWLLPIVVVLAVLGVLVIWGGGGLAPFIYTLF